MKLIQPFSLIGLMLGLLLSLPVPGQAEEISPTIVLEKSVHFTSPDGNDLLVPAGTYAVAGEGERLRLIREKEESVLVVEAQKGVYGQSVDLPIAVTIPGEGEESDVVFVALFMPNQTSLEAIGTYSGVRGRGFRDRAAQFRDKAKQTFAASFKKPAEVRLEESPRVPPAQFLIGSDNQFSNASGFRRFVCAWVGGHLIPQDDFGCQSYIDLNNGILQIKADRYGSGFRMGNGKSEAWVEMYKDFTVPPQSGSGQEQTKTATFNVPIEYHGKMASTHPLMASHYKLFLILNEVSFDAGPTRNVIVLEQRQLEDETVRAFIKVVKGVPIPIPDVHVDLTTQKNPVYFSAPVIPGRIYRLTIRVEVDAGGALGVQPPSGYGSAVNFMDKAMIISERQRVDGYIKWGNVKVRINP